MSDNLTTKLQKQNLRQEILTRWDIKIPVARAQRLSLAQLEGIKRILSGGN